MNEKIKKSHMDYGFGFPVKLISVPMIKIRGKWTPNIRYDDLSHQVLHKLCFKGSKLTGNEVRFIRLHFDLTLQKFAKRFCVTHVAVLKWEKSANRPTGMLWSTEKDIRLFVLSKLASEPKEMVNLYLILEEAKSEKSLPVELKIEKHAA